MYCYQCKFCNYEWSTEKGAMTWSDGVQSIYCPDCKQIREVMLI